MCTVTCYLASLHAFLNAAFTVMTATHYSTQNTIILPLSKMPRVSLIYVLFLFCFVTDDGEYGQLTRDDKNQETQE
jgi:hypothetical protein